MEMDFTKVKLTKEQKDNANLIGSKAEEYGIDPDLALAIAWRENRFTMGSDSPKGAIGIMQVMPENAKGLGLKVKDLRDPAVNVDAGLQILKQNLDMFNGNERAALVAYNANPNVAKRYLKNDENPETIPEETKTYLEDIHSIRPLADTEQVSTEESFFSPVEPLPEHMAGAETKTQQRSPLEKAVLPLTGLGLGTVLGIGESIANKATSVPVPTPTPTDPRFGTQAEFGTSGRARETAFNLETQRRAEQAAKNKEVIERMRKLGIITQDSPVLSMGPLTSTDTGVLVPPKALERDVTPPTKMEKFKTGVKAIPKGLGEFIKKHSMITGPLAGLGAGYSAEQARERFERGQIGGGLLSSAEALTSGVAAIPGVPLPVRGVAGALSLPVIAGQYIYDKFQPEYESVTKKYPPKD